MLISVILHYQMDFNFHAFANIKNWSGENAFNGSALSCGLLYINEMNPINSNYRILNLVAQKVAIVSYYSVFKSLSRLKRKLVKRDSLETALFRLFCHRECFRGEVWRHDASVAALIVNFLDTPVTVDARIWMNIPEQLIVYAPSAFWDAGKIARRCDSHHYAQFGLRCAYHSRFGLVNSCLRYVHG